MLQLLQKSYHQQLSMAIISDANACEFYLNSIKMNRIINPKVYGVKISVASIAGRCKYHRKVGQVYNLDDLAPHGMCLDAFHAAYPYCLSLLYGAKFKWMKNKKSVIAQGPNPKGAVVMEIRRKIISRNKKEILIKVIEIKGVCRKGLKRGQIFKMNLGDFPEMCPAAFDILYPY